MQPKAQKYLKIAEIKKDGNFINQKIKRIKASPATFHILPHSAT
jgi:hypothetical protein